MDAEMAIKFKDGNGGSFSKAGESDGTVLGDELTSLTTRKWVQKKI